MPKITELVYIDDAGFHVADFEDFLNYHQDALKTIYGQDINLDADSQDGQICAHYAQACYDLACLCAQVFNAYSPSSAIGDALSRQVRLNGIARLPATRSTVDLILTGSAGAGIRGGKVKDRDDHLWSLPDLVTIPTSGTITVTATADEDGALSAEINTITRIATPTEGWFSVTNPSPAVAGSDAESDASLRARQTMSTSLPSQAPLMGIQGGIANIDGVTRVKVYENDTSETDANGIPSHSIAAVVEGGDAEEIAETIRHKKPSGTGTHGTTVVTVRDPELNPINIRFFRPTQVSIRVKITLQPLAGYSSTYEDELRTEVVDYINSLGIGATVYLSKLYVPANLISSDHDSTYDVLGIVLAKNESEDYQAQNINTKFNEVPYTAPELVEIVINDE